MLNDVRRILLVGFMGAGKSTVGWRLARSLGWAFHDFDGAVEREEGRPIPQIFAESGEQYFREVEARTAGRLLAKERVVLGSGGGWAAAPGRLGALPEGTLSVWLKVSPEQAVARAALRPGRRPLLDVADPLSVARRLIAERTAHYSECDVEVDTEGLRPDDVAALIVELLGQSPATQPAAKT